MSLADKTEDVTMTRVKEKLLVENVYKLTLSIDLSLYLLSIYLSTHGTCKGIIICKKNSRT